MKGAVFFINFINMKNFILFSTLLFALFTGCIEDDFIDDFVEPEISITNAIDTLGIDTEFQFDNRFLNNVGQQESIEVIWESSDPAVISITQSGLATAHSAGTVIISVSTADRSITDSIEVTVGEETVVVEEPASITGTIVTTTFYDLEGTFTLSETDTGLFLDIADDYVTTSALPGFYIYLSNNRNSISNAFEIGEVTVFRGAHSYEIEGVGLNDYNFIVYYCKPFNVKVGEAELN